MASSHREKQSQYFSLKVEGKVQSGVFISSEAQSPAEHQKRRISDGRSCSLSIRLQALTFTLTLLPLRRTEYSPALVKCN